MAVELLFLSAERFCPPQFTVRSAVKNVRLSTIDADRRRKDRNVAGAHTESPEHNRVALPDPAIGDESPEQGREVHEPRVKSKDLRGECLRGKWTEDCFERRAQMCKASHVNRVVWQQELIDQVEREE